MRISNVLWACLTGCGLALGDPRGLAGAQRPDPPPIAAVDGTVVDSAGRGFSDVDVVVMDSRRVVRTNTVGAYRLDSLEPGPHILRFRRIGLRPVTLSVAVEPNNVTGVDVVMEPMIYQLATVQIQASNGDVLRVPRAFADRMKGQGQYLTEADIMRRRPVRTSDIFRGLAGIHVGRDGGVTSGRLSTFNGKYTESPCPYMPIYINGGTDANTTGAANPSSGGASALTLVSDGLESVDPTEIVGIEIYRGPASMPASLPLSPCGAIVIWTK